MTSKATNARIIGQTDMLEIERELDRRIEQQKIEEQKLHDQERNSKLVGVSVGFLIALTIIACILFS